MMFNSHIEIIKNSNLFLFVFKIHIIVFSVQELQRSVTCPKTEFENEYMAYFEIRATTIGTVYM